MTTSHAVGKDNCWCLLAKREGIGGWLLVEVVVLCSRIFKDMVILRFRQQGIVAKGCFQRMTEFVIFS